MPNILKSPESKPQPQSELKQHSWSIDCKRDSIRQPQSSSKLNVSLPTLNSHDHLLSPQLASQFYRHVQEPPSTQVVGGYVIHEDKMAQLQAKAKPPRTNSTMTPQQGDPRGQKSMVSSKQQMTQDNFFQRQQHSI